MQRQSPVRTRCSGDHSFSSFGIVIPPSGLVAVHSSSSATSYVNVRARTLTARAYTPETRPSGPSPSVPPMEQRLRPLSEEECYLRCYGWRGSRRHRQGRPGRPTPRSESPAGAHRADPARLRGAPRGPRARSRIAAGAPTPSAVPDVLAPGLAVVFCGINPGRFSDAANAHFANPRNDFWRLLHAAGLDAAAPRSRPSSSTCSRSGSASPTPPTAPRPARATSAPATSPAAPSGSRSSRASFGRA